MRVNVYAEEMTDHIAVVEKDTGLHKFTGVRFHLELPASFIPENGGMRPATAADTDQAVQMQAPFIHHPRDDDSAAVTFWGKRDLRIVLRKALDLLDQHYAVRDRNLRPRRISKKKSKAHRKTRR